MVLVRASSGRRIDRPGAPAWCRAAALGLCAGLALATPATADPATDALDAALRLESRGIALLVEQHQFEHALLAQDPERLSVFVSVTPAASAGLEEAVLHLDGKPVARHRYAPAELARLADGAVQPLYVGSVATGEHTVRLELRVRQGKVLAMPAFRFVKRAAPRVVELEIAGDATRQVRASSW